MRFTVLGGSGFIGSHLVAHLRRRGHAVAVPDRAALAGLEGPLGHVVYCIGLTADFRRRPFDTVEAHAALPARLLPRLDCDSFLYLSSTRLYREAPSGEETAAVAVDPADPSDLYNLTKLTGEAVCLAVDRPTVRVARLANVYGPDFHSENFLTDILRQAIAAGRVVLTTPRTAAKDYVAIGDVVMALERIAVAGRERIYNVASGRSLANAALLDRLSAITGCAVSAPDEGPRLCFPEISTRRLAALGVWRPRSLLEDLPVLVAAYREAVGRP